MPDGLAAPLVRRPAGPVVGRETELARLDAELERMATGAGSTVVIIGEPGIGKTVLLAELTRREALSEDATVDRAVGVIIAQRGCGVREAYDVLRDTAQRLGIDRHSVAERLVAAAARNATPH